MSNRLGRLTCLAVVAAVAICVFTPSEAGADHALPLYIAKIRAGMNRHQVRHTLGRPRQIATHRFQGIAYERQWRYRDHLAVGFTVVNGRTRLVDWVRTRSPKDRFAFGIHVGTNEHRLRRLGNVECWHLTYGVGSFPPGYTCAWRPPWNADACGPHLTFSMSHHHGRIRMIQLSGVPAGRQRMASRAIPLDGCI